MSLTGAKKLYNYMDFASQVHWENFRRISQFASVLLSHHHWQLSALKSCCRGFSNAPIANMGRTDPMTVPHTHPANIGWTVRHTPLGGDATPSDNRPSVLSPLRQTSQSSASQRTAELMVLCSWLCSSKVKGKFKSHQNQQLFFTSIFSKTRSDLDAFR